MQKQECISDKKTYNLTNVHQVKLAEETGAWHLCGESESGSVQVSAKFRKRNQKLALDLAQEWCRERRLPNFVWQVFAGKPDRLLLMMVEAATGVALSQRTENYEETSPERTQYAWRQTLFTPFPGRPERRGSSEGMRLVFFDGQEDIETGLGYIREYEPMYYLKGMGCYGAYLPVHLASQELLHRSVLVNETAIQHFLQSLVDASPTPLHFQSTHRMECIEQVGGEAKIDQLISQSISTEMQLQIQQVVKVVCDILDNQDRMDKSGQTRLTGEELAVLSQAEMLEGWIAKHWLPRCHWSITGGVLKRTPV